MAIVETDSVDPFLVMPLEVPVLFLDRVLVLPTAWPEPEPRFRFLMTSVFRLSGRTTPCSFRNKPQALQRGWPSGFRRQRGVVWVKQFVHVVGALLAPGFALPSPWEAPAFWRFVVEPCLEPSGGEEGRLVATDEKPVAALGSAGGEFGVDCASLSNGLPLLASPGVDAFLGTLPERPSDEWKDCDCDLFSPPPSQSPLDSPKPVVPPIVTCFRGGPAGYLAACMLKLPGRDGSHCIDELSKLMSSPLWGE